MYFFHWSCDPCALHSFPTRRSSDLGDSYLVAAKKGGANRLGYVFGHAAIVIICIGGLLDSDLPVRMQVWLGDKQDRKSTRLNSSHVAISYAVFCLKKKK